MATEEKDREVTFELVEHIGVFGKDTKGWTRELNKVAWNGGPAKFDVRNWDDKHQKMGRGITLTKEELAEFREILKDMTL
ncbi:MAG: PC4/YdbC family ssDNA-binding protein [Eubacteriales bacterium]|nr:PC4/YdbC family ssDNA-binding protein [Eubacteriales bacterium]MDD3349712.1 PC4/YdbC family ssDNA-binding protein [Eubacteriales bacterium]